MHIFNTSIKIFISELQFPAPIQAFKDFLPSRPCQIARSSRSEERRQSFFLHLFFQQIHNLHQCFLTIHPAFRRIQQKCRQAIQLFAVGQLFHSTQIG